MRKSESANNSPAGRRSFRVLNVSSATRPASTTRAAAAPATTTRVAALFLLAGLFVPHVIGALRMFGRSLASTPFGLFLERPG